MIMTNTNAGKHFPACMDAACDGCAPAEEGGEWEKKLKEWGQGVEIEGEHSIRDFPNDPSRLYLDSWLFNFIRTLLSRTRKEAGEKAWRAAVEAVPGQEKLINGFLEKDRTGFGRGWNAARQQLITAAKERGVNIEV